MRSGGQESAETMSAKIDASEFESQFAFERHGRPSVTDAHHVLNECCVFIDHVSRRMDPFAFATFAKKVKVIYMTLWFDVQLVAVQIAQRLRVFNDHVPIVGKDVTRAIVTRSNRTQRVPNSRTIYI